MIANSCKSIPQHRQTQVLSSITKSLPSEILHIQVVELLNAGNHDACNRLISLLDTKDLVTISTNILKSLNESSINLTSISTQSRWLVTLVNNTLNHPDIVSFMRKSDSTVKSTEMLSHVLNYLHKIRQTTEEKPLDQKLEKSVLNCLKMMIILLPINVLCHSLDKISKTSSTRTTLEKLSERLELITSNPYSGEIAQIRETFEESTSALLKVIESINSDEKLSQKQQIAKNKLVQLALYNLQLMVKLTCEDGSHTSTVLDQIFPKINTILDDQKVFKTVRASAMLLVSNMVPYIENGFLPHLQNFVKQILEFLNEAAKNVNSKQNIDILTWSVVALQNLTNSIGYFLSPYITEILISIGSLPESEEISKNLEVLQNSIAEHIPLRIFLPAIIKSSEKIKSATKLTQVMNLTANYLEKQSPLSVKAHIDSVRSWSELVLSFRESSIDHSEKLKVFEQSFAKAFLEFVKKLEEQSFSMVYYKLFTFATSNFKERPLFARELNEIKFFSKIFK